MELADALQTWAADRGWGQYPLPRSRPRRRYPARVGLRLVMGALGLFAALVLGTLLLAMIFGAAIFIHGALFG